MTYMGTVVTKEFNILVCYHVFRKCNDLQNLGKPKIAVPEGMLHTRNEESLPRCLALPRRRTFPEDPVRTFFMTMKFLYALRCRRERKKYTASDH